MQIKRYDSRAGRKLAIYETLYTLGRSFTMYEIADLLHMQPSTHLTKILMEMVAEGDLNFRVTSHRPNSNKRIFYLQAFAEPLVQDGLPL